jgi:hypothetical protein
MNKIEIYLNYIFKERIKEYRLFQLVIKNDNNLNIFLKRKEIIRKGMNKLSLYKLSNI